MRKAKICLIGTYRREFEKGFNDIDKKNIEFFINELLCIERKYNDIVEFVIHDEYTNYFIASCAEEVNRVCLQVEYINVDGIILLNLDFGDQRSAVEIGLTLSKPILLVSCKEKSEFYMNPICDTVCGTLMITSAFKKYSINYLFAGFFREECTIKKTLEFIKGIFCICNISDGYMCSIGNCPNNFSILNVNDETIKCMLNINIERYSLYSFMKKFGDVKEQDNEIVELKNEYSWLNICDEYYKNIALLYSALVNYDRVHNATCFSIDCWDDVTDVIHGNICVLNAILMDRGVCIACENDILSAIAMEILYFCSNLKKVTIMDVSNIEVKDNLILLWHCGNCCISLLDKDRISISCRNKTEITSYGLVQGEVTERSITLLSITMIKNMIKFLVFEGEVVHKESDIKGTFGFVHVHSAYDTYMKLIEEGATQHISLVEGKCMDVIDVVAKFWGIEVLHI